MDCWHCKRTAAGGCRFCGRGVCVDHAKTHPYILELFRTTAGPHKALVVDDALHCGVCTVRPNPVEVPGLG